MIDRQTDKTKLLSFQHDEAQDFLKKCEIEHHEAEDDYLKPENKFAEYMERFFTFMFFLALVTIPIQLLFSDYLREIDNSLLLSLQAILSESPSAASYFEQISSVLFYISHINFTLSIIAFIYFFADPGLAIKSLVCLTVSIFISFMLKFIMQDVRPFWQDSLITPIVCKLSFASPSHDLLTVTVFVYCLLFSIRKAVVSKDILIKESIDNIQIIQVLAIFLAILYFIMGLLLPLLGLTYVYQIIATYLYAFMLVRIFIKFNKALDYLTNCLRFVHHISNEILFFCFLAITSSAMIGCVLYFSAEDSSPVDFSRSNLVYI